LIVLHVRNIRSVFQYAQKREEVKIIPFNLVVFPPKGKDKSAEVIPQDDLKKLLLEIKNKDPQLFLACMIEYYCFIRPGTELRFLKVENINLIEGTIKVISSDAKNGKSRIVTMPTHLIELCKEYGIDKADSNLFVFGKNKGIDRIPISVNMLRYRFNKYRDKFELSKGIKFYSFKHTGATMLHTSKIVSTVELMNQLGHSHLTATQHYVKKHAGTINSEIRDNFPKPY
jgi:integrase